MKETMPRDYDPELLSILEACGATQGLLILNGGKYGSAWNAQVSDECRRLLPDLVRAIADHVDQNGSIGASVYRPELLAGLAECGSDDGILVVLNGARGAAVSAVVTPTLFSAVPIVLRLVADQVEEPEGWVTPPKQPTP